MTVTKLTIEIDDGELMECGHHLAPSADIYGRTSPARRRCWKCPER